MQIAKDGKQEEKKSKFIEGLKSKQVELFNSCENRKLIEDRRMELRKAKWEDCYEYIPRQANVPTDIDEQEWKMVILDDAAPQLHRFLPADAIRETSYIDEQISLGDINGRKLKTTRPQSKRPQISTETELYTAFDTWKDAVLACYPFRLNEISGYRTFLLKRFSKKTRWTVEDKVAFDQYVRSLQVKRRDFFLDAPFKDGETSLQITNWMSARSAARESAPVTHKNGNGGSKRAAPSKSTACRNWNSGQKCQTTPCNRDHVCTDCGGDHPKSACKLSSKKPRPDIKIDTKPGGGHISPRH
jgi:hypothetical protein